MRPTLDSFINLTRVSVAQTTSKARSFLTAAQGSSRESALPHLPNTKTDRLVASQVMTRTLHTDSTLPMVSFVAKPAAQTIILRNIPGLYPAVGPYSSALLIPKAENLWELKLSGLLGMNQQGEMAKGVGPQSDQILTHVTSALKCVGGTPENITDVRVFLADMNDFSTFNETYAGFFESHKVDAFPTRECVAVKELPLQAAKDAQVEIVVTSHIPTSVISKSEDPGLQAALKFLSGI
jgi:2-iminobutanoate/2-iminopropanoate deaminase